MIKTTAILRDELKNYVNPDAKIKSLVNKGELYVVTRGVYETERNVSGYCLSGVIYGPSYLSFEFAMSYYGLIPEAVYTFTNATCDKKRKKQFENIFGVFTYRDVPREVFPYDVLLKKEGIYYYWIASAEKAVCDMLYKAPPLNNRTELEKYLFDDLRIDTDALYQLDMDKMLRLCSLYHTKNHKLFSSFLKRRNRNGYHAAANAQ